jgi:hypothetical protein
MKIIIAVLFFAFASILAKAQYAEPSIEWILQNMEAKGLVIWRGNVVIFITQTKDEITFVQEMTKQIRSQSKNTKYAIAFISKTLMKKDGSFNRNNLIIIDDPTGNGINEMYEDEKFFTTGSFVLKIEWGYRYLFSEFGTGADALVRASVQPYYADTAHQYWKFTSLNNGFYKIVNGSGKCLDGQNNEAINNVVTKAYNGSNSQQWKIISTANDNYFLMTKDGRYLSIPRGGQVVEPSDTSKYYLTAAPGKESIDHYRWQLIKVYGNDRKLTAFKPEGHALRFVNAFAGEDFIRWGGLCGGMVYTALDYFKHNVPLPKQSWIPGNGTTLQSHIWQRQQHSYWNVHDRWDMLNTGFEIRRGEFFAWGTQGFGGGRFEELKNAVDGNKPVPVGLFVGNAISQKDGINNYIMPANHVALAYGYTMGRYKGNHQGHQQDLQILLWDPNYRNVKRTLIPNIAGQCYFQLETGLAWLTYFINSEHDNQHIPPTIPNFPEREPDGSIEHLYATFVTGGDDLRAYSTVSITVNYKDSSKQIFDNINKGFRWADNSSNAVHLQLKRKIYKSDIVSFTIHHGAISTPSFERLLNTNDNWNLDEVYINTGAGGIRFIREWPANAGQPYFRFTGLNTSTTIAVR